MIYKRFICGIEVTRKTVLDFELPIVCDAFTKSCSLTSKVCALANLAYPTQPPMERAMIKFNFPGESMAANAIARRIPGKDIKRVVTNLIT